MKARLWLRIAAVLQALGMVGHTINTASGTATHGSQEQAVFDAMQTFHFEVMGATRTVWDFYRGYGFSFTVVFAMMAVIIWMLGNLSVSSPRQALPMVATFLVSEILLGILGWTYFFAGPGVMSILISLCLVAAMISMSRADSVSSRANAA